MLNPALPRVIHHTWRHDSLVWPFNVCRESFRKLNPTWEHRFWTEDDCETFLRAHLPEFLGTCRKLPAGIYRSDLYKAAILYVHGGLYADLDVECLRPVDELLGLLPTGEWEVALARDHPDNELGQHDGRPMWPNAVMLAKPGSRFFQAVLDRLREIAERTREYYDPIKQTGAGVFASLAESAFGAFKSYRVQEIPWRWIYPLPRLQLSQRGTAQRKYKQTLLVRRKYRRLIRNKSWRLGYQISMRDDTIAHVPGEPPFCVHYWYEAGQAGALGSRWELNLLLQSDGEIVETKLQPWVQRLGDEMDAFGQAITNLAEQATIRAESGPAPGCCVFVGLPSVSSVPIAEHVQEIAADVFAGLPTIVEACSRDDWQGVGPDRWREAQAPICFVMFQAEDLRSLVDVLPALLSDGKYHADLQLLYLGSSDAVHEMERVLAEHRFVGQPASGGLLWLRTRDAVVRIPRIIHWCDGLENTIRAEAWLQANSPSGWSLRRWTAPELVALLAAEPGELLDAFYGERESLARWEIARYFVLRRLGGIVLTPGECPPQALEELVKDTTAFLLATDRPPDEEKERPIYASGEIMGSEPAHPLWIGIERDLSHRVESDPSRRALKSTNRLTSLAWLNERLEQAPFFLPREKWPRLVPIAGLRNASTALTTAERMGPPPAIQRMKILSEERGFTPASTYDLNVILLIHYRDSHKDRLESFKQYGLLNTSGYRVHVTLLSSPADAMVREEILRGWPEHLTLTLLEINSSEPIPKTNAYYFWMQASGLNARWDIRVDDDSITDVGGLMKYLDTFHDASPTYLMTSPNSWKIRDPIFGRLLDQMEISFASGETEYECAFYTRAALVRLLDCGLALEFLLRAGETQGAPGDRAPATAMRIAGIQGIRSEVSVYIFAKTDFSLCGGRFHHIHYVNWSDHTFLTMLSAFVNGRKNKHRPTEALRDDRSYSFGKCIGEPVADLRFHPDGAVSAAGLPFQGRWSTRDDGLTFEDASGARSILFCEILEHGGLSWLLGRSSRTLELYYLSLN